MNHFFKYYSLNTIFYLSEIVIFIFIYPSWPFDIFWFNIILRFLSAILFAIFARILIFNDANNFYKKFFFLSVINPILSSGLLKLFSVIYIGTDIALLKIISDFCISIVLFYALKKIS